MKRSHLFLLPLLALPPNAGADSCVDYQEGLPPSLSTVDVGSVRFIRIFDSIAYVGVATSSGDPPGGVVHLYDVDDPVNPTLLSTLDFDDPPRGFPSDAAVSNGVAFVTLGGWLITGNGGGFATVDVTDPSLPIELSFSLANRFFHRMELSEGIAYVAEATECCGGSTWIWDVSDPEQLRLVSVIERTRYDLALVGSVLYTSAGESILLYDVSTDDTPKSIGSIDRPDWDFQQLRLIDDRLVASVTDLEVGAIRLAVYDVTDPASPLFVGSTLSGSDRTFPLAVRDDVAYLKNSIIDLRGVTPREHALVELPKNVRASDTTAGTLWVGNEEALFAYPLHCSPAEDELIPPVSPVIAMSAPYRRGTPILLRLSASGPLRLDLFDVTGRRLHRLFDGVAGTETEVSWNGRDEEGRRSAAGVYFVRLATPTAKTSARLVLTD